MTDKEIIIDGVNVSKCFHYIDNKEYTCRLNHTSFHYRHCEENPNCYFKQLARKTQECEKLTNKNNLLTAELNQIKLLLEGKNTQYNVKVEECENLKEENQQLRMHFCSDCGEKDDYNIPCKMIRDLNYELQKEIEENDRYQKAFEEIEGFRKKHCDF